MSEQTTKVPPALTSDSEPERNGDSVNRRARSIF